MNPHEFRYLNWIVTARKALLEYDVSTSEELRGAVEKVSANAGRMLPGFDETLALDFTREVIWHQIWSAEDQSHPALLQNIDVRDPKDRIKAAAQGTGTVFCTFHTGSYRLLPYLLGVSGVPLALIADAEFVETQGEAAVSGMAKAQRVINGVEGAPLELLVAEDPTMPRKATRWLRRGGSVVLYLDGNTGVGGPEARTGNQVPVPFFGQTMAARKGAAFLSHLARAAIVPVVSSRPDWLCRRIEVHDPIRAEPGQTRDEFCEAVTCRLIALLEEHVRLYPSQWEAWLYVDKFLIGHEAETLPRYQFNAHRFGLARHGGQVLLIDKTSMRGRPVDEVLERTLLGFHRPRPLEPFEVCSRAVSARALAELTAADILVPEKSLVRA